MTERRAPSPGRPAVSGWAAAALAVSGSLAFPACDHETVDPPADGGAADAASEAPFMGGGICAEAVDAAVSDAPPPTTGGGGTCY